MVFGIVIHSESSVYVDFLGTMNTLCKVENQANLVAY